VSDVAAFDFDGTLTTGGSVFDFLSAVVGRAAVARASAQLAPRLAHAAVVGGEVADRTKEELFTRVLGGVDAEHLERVGAEFAVGHLAAHVRPEVRRRLDWHRGRGDRIVVVSASPDAYIREAAERLAAHGAIATLLEVDESGRLTGRYEGGNCRGEEKIRRLRLWMTDNDLEDARLWAYGNSRGDLRMLRAADTGVNVGRLGALGQLRDFPGLADTGPRRLDV
jgi:HAD superfamily hydrolase (TIGR01490 family)